MQRLADVTAEVVARGGLRFVDGPHVAAHLFFALDSGATLERIADADALPHETLEAIMVRLTEPI